MTDIVLEAEDVAAKHPGGPPILDGVTFRLRRGGRVALLGANGSGKTTLLRALAGAHRPTRGRVLLGGAPLGRGAVALREHRHEVQLVLQDPDDQLFSADVAQDVSFGPLNLGLGEAEVRARVAEALGLMGVGHLAERATHHLSYGERKRVATAGAVAMRPSVLLLDEPSAGLDPAGVDQLVEALDRLQALGTTIALATHDVDLALRWADEAAVLCAGRVTQGPVLEVLGDETVVGPARLRRPWPLELAARLGLPPVARTLDELVAALTQARQP